MNDNPLAGLRIPALRDIVEQAIGTLGIANVDLANPLQKRRLINALAQRLGMSFEFELERAIQAATTRAVTYTFKVMRDPDYQEKKRAYRKQRQQKLTNRREEKKIAEQQARMNYTKSRLDVTKATVQ